tara:strand:+ start:272 stop:664 length:393 start_codon:yes stop_codon:yes gene_type:complete
MSKMYKIEDGVVLRNNEAIATYENGELNFFSGKAKYRIPVAKWLNKAVKAPKNERISHKEALNETKEPVSEKNWLDCLSDIVRTKVPYPHKTKGWRGTKYRELLTKNYNKILKSDTLSNNEKKLIVNKFI